jgi:GYF domain 2
MQLVCRTCSAVQSVVPERESHCVSCGAALSTSDAPERPRGTGELWFTMGAAGQAGPHDAEQLAHMFDLGELAWTDKVWREGLRDWRPARRDEVLVVAVANARGLDTTTMRLDSLARLLGHAPGQDRESPLSEEFELVSGEDTHEDSQEDTQVDAIPAGLASSWPVRQAWVTGPQRGSSRPYEIARVLRLATLALLAFVGGGLIVGVTGRVLSMARPKPTSVQSPPAAHRVATVSSSLARPRARFDPQLVPPQAVQARPSSGELVKRTLPALDEVRAELRRISPSARRCVRDPKHGVELDVTIAGASGRTRQVDVRTSRLTPGAIECTKAAIGELEVAPFTADQLVYRHRYAW